jgi:hypothetical protein
MFIDDSHSDWSEVESQCLFDSHFLLAKDGEHFFLGLLAICNSSFENCLVSFFAHLLRGLSIL